MADWYSFGSLQSRRHSIPLDDFDGSVVSALKTCFPDHKWQVWKFAKVPQGWWADQANQRLFFEEAGEELGVGKLDDWYGVSRRQLVNVSGVSLLVDFYKNNLFLALSAVFPEHRWLPWKFSASRVPLRFWADEKNQRAFLDWCYTELRMESLDDWYRVPVATVASLRGGAMLRTQFSFSLFRALTKLYPEHHWDVSKFNTAPYASTVKELHDESSAQR